MPGPPMNLCGDMNIASLRAAGSPSCGFISMSTYGAAAATSHSASAPCSCSSRVMACVSVTMPVTLLAALKEPILSAPVGVLLELGTASCSTSM